MTAQGEFSRREFGALLGGSSLAAGAGRGGRLEPRAREATGAGARIVARPFPLRQVRLLSGSAYTLQNRNRSYLHPLDSDRLLHTFRLTAGLPSNARQLGGWERPDIELRGHFLGHYLSACGLMYSSSRSFTGLAADSRLTASDSTRGAPSCREQSELSPR